MESSAEPLVVLQTNAHGHAEVVGLAVEQKRVGNVAAAEEGANSRSMPRPTGVLPSYYYKAETESTSRASTGWSDDLRTRLRGSRRSAVQPGLSVVRRSTTTIDRLAAFLANEESPKTQERAAQKLAELSAIDEHRSTIAQSAEALAELSRTLFVDSPSCLQYLAAVVWGNLAAIEDNLKSFKQFPDTVSGLVNLLFRFNDKLAQQGAAMALANLSLWREGGKMILSSPPSIRGLVGLSMAVPSASSNGSNVQNCGQDDAKRALLNLALLRENKPILECPSSLPALARFLSPHNDELEQEDAVKALASLAYTKENSRKIAGSTQFPLFLAALVRFLDYSSPATTGSTRPSRAASGNGIAVRKMAATALTNLSITDDVQMTVAEFPNALTGLFSCLRVREGEEAAVSLQLQECAAMALGNLALAKENRKRIVDFGSKHGGLVSLADLLFQDENPGGQEYAAWALANLSHDPCDSEETAVKIANTPNIVRGLVRLLLLPTSPVRQISGSRSSLGVQEQALRALANLTFPHENQVKIARVPHVVSALAAALLSRRCHQPVRAAIQEHASRALANLTSAKENWKSSQVFGDAFRALVDVLSVDNEGVSPKTWKWGAIALGNFAMAPSHHRAIVESKQAMTGLVRMLFRSDSPVTGKEQAAWTLANLANGDFSIKAAIASFPFAVTGLLGLLSSQECSVVQDQARRALAGLRDVGLDKYVASISVATAVACDSRPSHPTPLISRFDISHRAAACI